MHSMIDETVFEPMAGENYCINCGKPIPFIGNPFTPGTWVCEECQEKMIAITADMPE